MQAHLRIGPEVVRKVAKPVAHRIVDAAVPEAGAHDNERRLDRDVADLGVSKSVGDCGNDARGPRIVGHAEFDVAP